MKKVSFLLPVVFCFMISCQDKQVVADLEACKTQKEIEKLNKSVVQSYWNGKWNERRPEILDELLTQDVIHHGSNEMTGIEEYKQVYGMYLSAMGESNIKVEKLIAEGDFVMSQARIQAIHNGQLGDIPPTGNEVTLGIFTVFRLVDGKIAEEWELMEELAMMTQLGFELVPSSK
jgi:predicted ester cyclase